MRENEKWYSSTAVIIITLICFWPLGLVFLYLRLSEKNGRPKKYKDRSNILLGLGVALAGFGIIGIGTSIGEDDFATGLACGIILFILPGATLLFFGVKRKKEFKLYNQYLKHINARHKITIDILSERIETDRETVINVVTDMIHKGIVDGYINDSDCLILNGYNDSKENIEIKNENVVKIRKIIVKCKECGAKNELTVGVPKECEYCGTMLQG